MNLPEIITQLKSCGYMCEAGPLENNIAFMELEKLPTRLEALERLYQSELQDEHDMPHFQRTVDPVWMILKELEAMS